MNICNNITEYLEIGNEEYIEIFYIVFARYITQNKNINNSIPNLP